MTTSNHTRFELVSALRQQLEAGIDIALDNQPGEHADFHWQHDSIISRTDMPPPVVSGEKAADTVTHHTAPSSSHNHRPLFVENSGNIRYPAFERINSLSDLKHAMERFDGCALKKTASNLVFADGHEQAEIMIIGEAPGRDEDRMGLPFVGAAGQLLDKMLRAIGLHRNDVYITNILPWRPPGNRTPSAEEVQMMTPFLSHHIRLKSPKIIFALGGSSAKLLLNSQQGIMKLRGRLAKLQLEGAEQIDVLPSLHPAYLLRAPAMKKLAYTDLLTLKKLSSTL